MNPNISESSNNNSDLFRCEKQTTIRKYFIRKIKIKNRIFSNQKFPHRLMHFLNNFTPYVKPPDLEWDTKSDGRQ